MDKNVFRFRIIGLICLILSLINLIINIKVLDTVKPSTSVYWLSIVSFIAGFSSLLSPKYFYCTICTLCFSFASVICGIAACISESNWLTTLKNNVSCIYSNGYDDTTYTGNSNYYQ